MSDVARHISDLPPDQKAIRAKCFHPTGVFIEFTGEEVEQPIPDRFERIVRKYPDRIAAKTDDRALTYDQLNKVANRVARAILREQGKESEPVVLLFEHGIQAIAAILGVLKAGKFFVPLDPSLPHGRIASILEDSGARLIVTNRQHFSLASQLVDDRSQRLDIDAVDAEVSDENLCLPISPDSFACIMYTSGSTGKPKGVVLCHGFMLHRAMVFTNLLHICPEDRLTLLYSFSFAASINILFSSLLSGASLFPFDPRWGGDAQLAKWLVDEQISIYESVPAVFRQMTASLTGEEQFPHLRAIILAAAPVTGDDVESYKRHFPERCILLHFMGSTECGIVRHYFIDKTSQIASSTIPVGYAAEGKEVILLDDSGCEVGVGQVGEMAIKSRYLAAGYWREPELTNARFLQHPSGREHQVYLMGDLGRMEPDGCLLHFGRKDFQVKIRGYRVEVSEVEMALLEHPAVKEVAVVGREVQTGDRRLVAYCVPTGEPAPSISALRSFLKRKLPDYMIPSAFVRLHALPLTPNGKIDRRSLPDPGSIRPELDGPFVAPRTPVEEELARIWTEVLSLDEVGVHDNFFELGGHSLVASQVISRVIKSFQLDLPLQSLFQAPTVAEMAVVIMQNQAKKAGKEEMARMVAELEVLPDEEAQRLLTEETDTERRKENG